MRVVHAIAVFVLVLFSMGATGVGVNDTGEIIAIIREFGFPVFVSLWFMWRVEKRMDRFTDAIQDLLTAVTIMAKTVDDISHEMPREESGRLSGPTHLLP